MFAAHNKLANVTAIVDHNGLQIDGSCDDVITLGEVAAKFAAFGWNVFEVDGHDVDALTNAFAESSAKAAESKTPSVLVCRTVKGKGVSFMEGDAGWHGKAPSEEQTAMACDELLASLTDKEAADVR